MARQPNSTVEGHSFSSAIINAVWQKAQTVSSHDSNKYRKDQCGSWIQKSSYGLTGDYGWEVDHIKPVAKGGSDDISNLQPLHWKNNRGKSDNFPNWNCSIK